MVEIYCRIDGEVSHTNICALGLISLLLLQVNFIMTTIFGITDVNQHFDDIYG